MTFEFQVDHGPVPTADEAAALVAAVERFLRDTSISSPSADGSRVAGWLRAALHEGIGSEDPDRVW